MGLSAFVIVGIWDLIPRDLEHSCDGKTYFLPTLTVLIPKGLTNAKMSVDVKKKGEDAMGSTSTLNT